MPLDMTAPTACREPASFRAIVACAAHAIALNLRQGGSAHVWAWPSLVRDGAPLPGCLIVTRLEETPADPYAAHRTTLPIYVRPASGRRWGAVPWDYIEADLRRAAYSLPILGAGDPHA